MKKQIICNCCGKMIHEEGEVVKADYLYVQKEWGYFSTKDGQKHEFYLCESCYDEITSRFRIPVEAIEVTELV